MRPPRPAGPQLRDGGLAPDLLHRRRSIAQLGRGHRKERCQPPRPEVDAHGPGRGWVAELPRTGGRGDRAAVGVLHGFYVGPCADEKRRREVDDEQRRGRRRQYQPGVRRGALQVVEVADQPVQRRTWHPGHVLHAHSIADAPPASCCVSEGGSRPSVSPSVGEALRGLPTTHAAHRRRTVPPPPRSEEPAKPKGLSPVQHRTQALEIHWASAPTSPVPQQGPVEASALRVRPGQSWPSVPRYSPMTFGSFSRSRPVPV